MITSYDHDLSLCFVFCTFFSPFVCAAAACMFKDMENFPIIVSFWVQGSSSYTACLMLEHTQMFFINYKNSQSLSPFQFVGLHCTLHAWWRMWKSGNGVTNGGTSKPKFSSQVPRVEGRRSCPSLLSTRLPVCRVSERVSRPPSSRSLIMKNQLPQSPLNSHVRHLTFSTYSLRGIHGSKVYNGNYPSKLELFLWAIIYSIGSTYLSFFPFFFFSFFLLAII
jgi:hypothetical protein